MIDFPKLHQAGSRPGDCRHLARQEAPSKTVSSGHISGQRTDWCLLSGPSGSCGLWAGLGSGIGQLCAISYYLKESLGFKKGWKVRGERREENQCRQLGTPQPVWMPMASSGHTEWGAIGQLVSEVPGCRGTQCLLSTWTATQRTEPDGSRGWITKPLASGPRPNKR